MKTLSVIVPTYNNPEQLTQMINSMTRIGFFDRGDRQLIIVNNGKQPCEKDYAHILAKRSLFIANAPDNLGWEGGLKHGLKYADSEYVCFQNDDVHIPQNQTMFYENLMNVDGMCGPITTTAAGVQSIYNMNSVTQLTEVRWLIFFCVMMKRDILESVGGVDDTLPGGDDFDLSIRMRKAGNHLLVNPNSFIVHHGFQTGTRVKGGPEKDGGWNSRSMSERTNKAIIQKHGFKVWFETMHNQIV